jgi:hypothetical protein
MGTWDHLRLVRVGGDGVFVVLLAFGVFPVSLFSLPLGLGEKIQETFGRLDQKEKGTQPFSAMQKRWRAV